VFCLTTPVGEDVAERRPAAFAAVTVTTRVAPACADLSWRVDAVAPAIGEQCAPAVSHDDHAYAYEVGDPVQDPLDAVNVWPTTVRPEIAGTRVLVGG